MKKDLNFWFITGSQNLYGEAVLKRVSEDSKKMVDFFNNTNKFNYKIIWKETVKSKEEIYDIMLEANSDKNCGGIITWMHTFSPSKMWINGLNQIKKPILHLHTQFNKEIPWNEIDMNFMNTNQSAHGDREHGYIFSRMGIKRKVVAGYYANNEVIEQMSKWQNVAAAVTMCKDLKVARFGDNMRQVAVTEGDKVEAEIKFGWSVDYHGVGDLVEYINKVTDDEVEKLYNELKAKYTIPAETLNDENNVKSIKYQAKMEIGMRRFLDENGYSAYTNTFEDLHGLDQLPGLASQRLMEQGYGFGPEGDWKVAAMTRIMKVMTDNKGTSLMEDYTYHFEDNNESILGAHMLEVCPTLAKDKPAIEVHPLGIGGKNPPARLVFDGKEGKAVCVSLVDMGNRFRLIILDVEAIKIEKDMPNLPVARVMWKPEPNMIDACKAWIYAGGAHHTVFSYNVDSEDLIDFAEMMDIEYVLINKDTNINTLKKELELNDLISKLK